ncbi:MAG: hypothetical protein U0Z26_12870 [Anaerolineales bacterium]
MNFDIVEILTRAWKITWKYKVLWIFGILASCGRRSGGNLNNNQQSSSNQFSSDNPLSEQMMQQISTASAKVTTWLTNHPAVLVVFFISIIIILILQIFMSTTGKIGLIQGAYQVETGSETINFGSLFSESLHHFWRVIGLGLVIFLPVLLLFTGFLIIVIAWVSSSPATSSGPENGVGALAVIFFAIAINMCCCLLPIVAILRIYYNQSIRAAVLGNMGIRASLSRGWEIFRKNIGGLLFTAVIIFIINFIVGLVVSIPFYIAMASLLIKVIQGDIDSWRPFIVAGTLVLCYSPIAWFLIGIFTTYTETIWTLIYMRTTQPKENSSIPLPANA